MFEVSKARHFEFSFRSKIDELLASACMIAIPRMGMGMFISTSRDL